MLVFFLFFISANLAWLNPRGGKAYKTHKTIPIFWQYNSDAPTEFLTAAYFPEGFKRWKTRVNRPVYAMMVNSFGGLVGLITYPFYKMDKLEKAMMGYLLLKLSIYFLGAILLFEISKAWFDAEIALLSVFMLLLHPFAIVNLTTFHTNELQFINPIIILFLFNNLINKFSTKKIIVFSFVVGTLMLARQNYAIYLSVLFFSFFKLKQYKASILSFFIHLMPLIIWYIFLKWYGLDYYNHEVEAYEQGAWLFKRTTFIQPLALIQSILIGLYKWLNLFPLHYSVLLLGAILTMNVKQVNTKLHSYHYYFLGCFFLFSFIQTYASKRYAPYMIADTSFLIYPLVAYFIITSIRKWNKPKLKRLFVSCYLCIALISIVHFPWVHPYNQVDILDQSKSKIKQLEEGKLLLPSSEGK